MSGDEGNTNHRPSFLRYAVPNYTPDRTGPPTEGLELKIHELENTIEENKIERQQMMIEGQRLLTQIETMAAHTVSLKEEAISHMRSLHEKIQQAEDLLADARSDCTDNVILKQSNDNLQHENLLLKDQIKSLVSEKIEMQQQPSISQDIQEDKERMRAENNRLADELKQYKPVEGYVCTNPYSRDSVGGRKESCTPTTGTPSSFDDVRRDPVTGSRFTNRQPCVSQCYKD